MNKRQLFPIYSIIEDLKKSKNLISSRSRELSLVSHGMV